MLNPRPAPPPLPPPPGPPEPWIKLNGLNKRRYEIKEKKNCKLRACRRHHLCLWNTIHVILMLTKEAESLSRNYYKLRWNYYKLRQLILVYYKVRWTVITNCESFFITKCDTVYYKLRQVLQSAMIITNCDSTDDIINHVTWANCFYLCSFRTVQFTHYRSLNYSFGVGHRVMEFCDSSPSCFCKRRFVCNGHRVIRVFLLIEILGW